jgi:hypothetical protein
LLVLQYCQQMQCLQLMKPAQASTKALLAALTTVISQMDKPIGPQAGELHLPAPNPYIPTDFKLHSLVPGAASHPTVVRADSRWRLFHQLDLTFEQPKVCTCWVPSRGPRWEWRWQHCTAGWLRWG